jgi:hypothetical protein
VALLATGAIALWLRHEVAERRAISRLPVEERAELFRREINAFQALCGRGPRTDALQAQCKEKAEFILKFPECDQSCQQLARSHMPKATR